MNLLAETIAVMKRNHRTSSDIVFIGSLESGHQCTWDEFVVLADVDYDDGYGATEVALDLVIVFSNGDRLERRDYDGSEWWEMIIAAPPLPEEKYPIESLVVREGQVGWVRLEEIQEAEK